MSWLRRTGQTWKFVVFWLGCLPGGLGVFTGWFNDFRWTLFSLAVFAWFMVAVRCPKCGGRPAWYLATSVRAGEFDARLRGDVRCPICHDGEEQPVPPPPLFSAYRDM